MSDAYIADCVSTIAELQEFLDTYKKCNVNIIKLIEKICDIPLINLGVFYPFEIEDFRKTINAMETEAVSRILDIYKQIVTYLVVVYEGFEANITLMAEHWIDYIRKFDCILAEAFRVCVKETLKIFYRSVYGDGTFAPSPLIKGRIKLNGDNIEYSPKDEEVVWTLSSVLPDIVDIIGTVPRLFEKFSLPGNGLKKFSEIISEDEDCNHLQELYNRETILHLGIIGNYMQIWIPYEHIWKVNKDVFLEQFEEEKHPATDFDELINMYNELANAVQAQETTVVLRCAVINNMELKQSIIEHCITWQTRLADLLRKQTEADIVKVYEYVENSTEEASKTPQTLNEMSVAITTYERLMSEVPIKEAEFPPITDEMTTLGD